jgi:hypothetical protein
MIIRRYHWLKGDTDRINFIFDYVPPSAREGRVAVTGAQAVPAGS